jgi:hypothetical protein
MPMAPRPSLQRVTERDCRPHEGSVQQGTWELARVAPMDAMDATDAMDAVDAMQVQQTDGTKLIAGRTGVAAPLRCAGNT